jgi:hypothetical protein
LISSASTGLHSVVVIANTAIATKISDEMVILDMQQGIYYSLNAVGARIWSLMEEPRSVQAICDALIAEYEVMPEQCEQEVVSLLQQLIASQLVEVRVHGDAPRP